MKKILILLIFVISIVFYSCGGDNNNTQRTTESVDTILIPLYSYPVGEYSQEWEKLYNFNTSKNVFVIVNVDNGPSNGTDNNYAVTISKLKEKGFYVIGYVYSNYTKRDINLVKTDIDNWLQFYPGMLNGFFIDEVADHSYTYYAEIYNYIKYKNPKLYVVLNPGTVVDNSYWVISDKIVVFENSYNEFKKFNYSFNSQKSSNVCIIVYDVPDKTSFDDVKSKGLSLNSSCQYITNYNKDIYFYVSNYLWELK